MLQNLNSSFSPIHGAPPYAGLGLSHCRVRKRAPVPHEREQSPHVPQALQPDKEKYEESHDNAYLL